jgi:hypothetical protein
VTAASPYLRRTQALGNGPITTFLPLPTDENQMPQTKNFSPAEIRYWLEFGCWTTLALVPFLYWVHGPAVSEDQCLVRTALLVVAAFGAIGLRAYNLRHRRRP